VIHGPLSPRTAPAFVQAVELYISIEARFGTRELAINEGLALLMPICSVVRAGILKQLLLVLDTSFAVGVEVTCILLLALVKIAPETVRHG
jgi:hypothetical protein